MSRVFLGIGSNREAPRHISLALDALAERYGDLQLSSVYESEAVGFSGANFLNLVAGVQTDEPVEVLSRWLKAFEIRYGRGQGSGHQGFGFGRRKVDIDILTYDAVAGTLGGVCLPRGEILENAFVLWPLAEIAGNEVHPVLGQTYGDLWRGYGRDQKLWKVPFSWRGRVISPRAG